MAEEDYKTALEEAKKARAETERLSAEETRLGKIGADVSQYDWRRSIEDVKGILSAGVAAGGDLQKQAERLQGFIDLRDRGLISGADAASREYEWTIGARDLQSRAVDALLARQKEIAREKEAAGQREMELLSRGIAGREAAAESLLSQRTSEAQTALDRRLASALEETGIAAGEARQMVGQSLVDRGLLRSTFANEQIGRVNQAEFQERAQAQTAAARGKAGLERAVGEVREDIAQRRERAQISRSLTEMRSAADLGFAFDSADIERQTQEMIADLEMAQADQSILGSVVGGILGAAATIFTGGLAGPAVAAGVGGVAGAGVKSAVGGR